MSATRSFIVRTGEGSVQSSNDLSGALNEWMERAGPTGLFRTCGSCMNMAKVGPAICALYACPPPIDIILKGCDSYKDELDLPY